MRLNIKKIAEELEKIPNIDFAYIFGSSKDGFIKNGSDLDIAVYFSDNISVGYDKVAEILRKMENVTNGVQLDLCRLNTASETLRFEVLKGKCLFVRRGCMDKFSNFYSRTCREYEDYSFWAGKQLEYRGA